MKLLLHLETGSDINAVLAAAYAFVPQYVFTHIGNGTLEATIDASHDLTQAQWTVIANGKYSVALVLPDGVTPPATTTPAPVSAPSV